MREQELKETTQEAFLEGDPTQVPPTLRERLLAGKIAAGERPRRERPEGVLGAGKQIRKFCLECVGGPGGEAVALVKCCTGFDCPLWYWRFGKDPRTVKDESLIDKAAVKDAAVARERRLK